MSFRLSLTSTVDPELTPAADGGATQALKIDTPRSLLFISGQIPVAWDGRLPQDFAAQCQMAWRNLALTLEAAQMTLHNLVKVTTFLADPADRAEDSRIRQQILGSHRVALTVVIARLQDPAWQIQIKAIAAA